MKGLCVKIIRGIIVVLSKLPLKFHYFMGDILSWFMKNVVRYRSAVVYVNLSRSFPEKSAREIKKIYDAFYKHMGEIVAEAIWFGGSTYRRLYESGIVTVVGKVRKVSATSIAPNDSM